MTPTYDPQTGTWFLEDGREAKRLRDFNLSLEGYYPGGVPLEVIKQKMAEQAAILGTDAPQPKASIPVKPTNENEGAVSEWKGALPPARIAQPASPYPAKPKGRTRIYDHEGILADRRNGLSYQEIVDKRGLPSKDVVASVVAADNKRRRELNGV